jgi:hypothetical protein
VVVLGMQASGKRVAKVGVAGEDRVGEREEGEVSTDVVRRRVEQHPIFESTW